MVNSDQTWIAMTLGLGTFSIPFSQLIVAAMSCWDTRSSLFPFKFFSQNLSFPDWSIQVIPHIRPGPTRQLFHSLQYLETDVYLTTLFLSAFIAFGLATIIVTLLPEMSLALKFSYLVGIYEVKGSLKSMIGLM